MNLDDTPQLTLLADWRWFVPLGLIAWALLLATVPRTRNGLALTLLSVLTHLATYAPRVHMHDLTAYQHILDAYGLSSPDLLYGEGRAALLTWPLWLMRWPIDGVHWIDAALATLVVPQLYAVMRSLYDERTAVFAAVLYALAPLPLALAPTETAFVPLVTMEVLAVHGLVRGGRLGDAMLVIGAGMVTHLRPLEGLVGVGFVLAALVMGRWRGAVGVVAFVGWRLYNWAFLTPDGGGLQLAAFWQTWDSILLEFVGRAGRAMVFDPSRTPAALALLAIGAVVVDRRRRATWGIAALCAFGTVAYVNQGFLADRIRYQLPAQVWLCALAGVGLAAVWERRALAAAVIAALTVSWGVALRPYPPFPWQVEYATLRTALQTLPPGTKVAFDDGADNHNHQRVWARLFRGVELVPLSQATPDVRWRWVGLADHLHGVQPPLPDPVVSATILPMGLPIDPVNNAMWGCAPCSDAPVQIGLFHRDGAAPQMGETPP